MNSRRAAWFGVCLSLAVCSEALAEDCKRIPRFLFFEMGDETLIYKTVIESVTIDVIPLRTPPGILTVLLGTVSIVRDEEILNSGPLMGVRNGSDCPLAAYAEWENGPWSKARQAAMNSVRRMERAPSRPRSTTSPQRSQ